MKIDERLGVVAYVRLLLQEIDGRVWLAITLGSLISLLDYVSGLNIIPLREASDFGKTVVLLLFTPLIIFLVITTLRQLPFSSSVIASFGRALFCIFVFLLLNF